MLSERTPSNCISSRVEVIIQLLSDDEPERAVILDIRHQKSVRERIK